MFRVDLRNNSLGRCPREPPGVERRDEERKEEGEVRRGAERSEEERRGVETQTK